MDKKTQKNEEKLVKDILPNTKKGSSESNKLLFVALNQAQSDVEREKIISEIYLNNIGLINFVIKKLNLQNGTGCYSLEDLHQEGAIGLIIAINRYDTSKGEFSTYAVYWIMNIIQRNIYKNAYATNLPVHIVENWLKIKKAIAENNVASTNKEDLFNVDALNISDIMKKTGLTESQVNSAIQAQAFINYLSLQKSINNSDNEQCTLEDFMQDKSINVESEAINNIYNSQIRNLLKKLHDNKILSDGEYDVIRYRFGFETGESMTLSEIGVIRGVSRERIRQLESSAIKKIRTRFNKIKRLQ